MNIFNNIKLIAILILAVTAVFFYKDSQYQKSENKRQTQNAKELRRYYLDSAQMATQILDKKEMNEYLLNQNKELGDKLKQSGINYKRIEKIIEQKLSYRDTVNSQTPLPKIVKGIRKGITAVEPFKDENPCLIIKGYVMFKNDSLSLNITDRKFTNKSQVVSYWQRNQWKFIGIPTRLFGKKEAVVKVYDECGRSETIVVKKR